MELTAEDKIFKEAMLGWVIHEIIPDFDSILPGYAPTPFFWEYAMFEVLGEVGYCTGPGIKMLPGIVVPVGEEYVQWREKMKMWWDRGFDHGFILNHLQPAELHGCGADIGGIMNKLLFR